MNILIITQSNLEKSENIFSIFFFFCLVCQSLYAGALFHIENITTACTYEAHVGTPEKFI